MECRDIHKRLSEYVDDVLSPQETMVIDEHLKACRECRVVLADLKETLERVKGLEIVEPPVWLTQKIMAQVRAEALPKKSLFQKLFYPLYIKLPVGAIVTIAIALTTLYVFRTIEPEMRLAKVPSEEAAPQILQREIIKEDRVRPLTRSGEGKPPQEITTAPEKPPEEVVTGKVGVKADKIEETPAGKARPGKSDVSHEPAPQKAQERLPAAGTLARGEAQQETRAAAPKAKLSYLEKQEEQALSVTVFVKDPITAVGEIEKILKELEGKTIRTESMGEKRIVTAEVNATKLREVIERLKVVGQVKERKIDFESLKGEVNVKIEIVKIFEGR